jgi:hypothetical protein
MNLTEKMFAVWPVEISVAREKGWMESSGW